MKIEVIKVPPAPKKCVETITCDCGAVFKVTFEKGDNHSFKCSFCGKRLFLFDTYKITLNEKSWFKKILTINKDRFYPNSYNPESSTIYPTKYY